MIELPLHIILCMILVTAGLSFSGGVLFATHKFAAQQEGG